MPKFSELFQQFSRRSTILLSPMEWGLGHASRCIPVLDHLIHQIQARVIVAANGPQAALIRAEFPSLPIVPIPSYSIRYRKYRAGTVIRLAFSLPHLARTIRAENQWLRGFCRDNQVDAIISDNRYGLWHPEIPSYLITHQLAVKSPLGAWSEAPVRRQIYRYINRFTACWVPDYPEKDRSMAGDLAHPRQVPETPVHYIGPLTRIRPQQAGAPLIIGTTSLHQIQLLVILSGPEPQRTILEQRVIHAWKQNPGRSLLLVRGLPHLPISPLPELPNAVVVNHLETDQLSQAIANSSAVLSRSGYSSIMDLLPHHSNIWMVPTPGQTEQEYLALYLSGKGRIQAQQQDQFDLSRILAST